LEAFYTGDQNQIIFSSYVNLHKFLSPATCPIIYLGDDILLLPLVPFLHLDQISYILWSWVAYAHWMAEDNHISRLAIHGVEAKLFFPRSTDAVVRGQDTEEIF
jgi:hypothetical protein